MSDNNLDIRARLTGDDRLSPTIVKLLAKIKSLEEQMKKLGKAGSSIDTIPMESYVKSVNKAKNSLNGLTKKHYDWAKANGVHSDKAALEWGKLTNRIIALKKEHEGYVNSHKRGSATMAKNTEKLLRNEYKNAQAFRFLYNKTNDDRLAMHRRLTEQLSNLEAAHLRNEERRNRTHFNNIARMRRDALRGVGSMSNLGNRAIPYAAAAAGATGYGAVSAFRTRMKVDTAETNLRMFGEMSQADVKQWRKDYGNRAAIKYGMGPAEMIDSLTEVRKAGIGKDKAQEVTDTILKSGAGLDLDLKETTRFATRLATLTQDMSNLDPGKLKAMLNSVAIANIATAADGNEIIAANRRASSVFSASKFDPNDLSAFTGAGISAGMPSAKTGTFLGFMVNELVGAKNARGQRATDLGKAANLLGMGGRQKMAHSMAADPTGTLMSIFDKMGNMSAEKQSQVATLLGMREWRDELQTFVQVRDDVRRTLKEIHDPKNASKLDEISAAKLKSLAGRWKSLVSAMTLVWESVGAGLEKAFGEISSFFTDYLATLDTEKITAIVEGFTDGLVQGLGFDNWTAMLTSAFGDPKEFDGKGWAEKVRLFTKGFVSEMVKMWKVVSGMFNAAAAAFDGTDPEAMGRFTGHLIELVVALKSIGALAETMVTVVHFFEGLAAILAVLKASPVLQFIAKYAGGPGSVAAIGATTTNQEDSELNGGAAKWKMLREKYGQGTIDAARKKYQPWYQFGNGYADENEEWIKRYLEEGKKDPNFKKSSFNGATDFSSRGRNSDLAENLSKFTGKVELAAFRNSGLAGGLQYASIGGGGGSGLGLTASGGGGGGLLGGVPSLLKSTPGSALPSFGVGRSGSILRHGGVGALTGASKVPSIGGGSSKVDDLVTGKGLSGNAFLAARRARFADEIKSDPKLQMDLAAMQLSEGASGGATIESLFNRADMRGWSLRKGLGLSADGQIDPNSFYGPIRYDRRDHKFTKALNELKRNPKLLAQMNGYTAAALAGSHRIGGYTDQGLPTDPNGSVTRARKGLPRLPMQVIGGNEFLDWGAGKWDGKGGHAGSAAYRQFIEKGIAGTPDSPIGGVPTPSDVIKNVPAPAGRTPGVGAGDIRPSGGPVAIHINGSSHDPEALATLVQRRIDEAMNWRTHDTASEYT